MTPLLAVPDLMPSTHWTRVAAVLAALLAGGLADAHAQQKIGYIDSGYVLDQMPEYAAVQQKLDQLEQQWRQEIEVAQKRVETLEQEFQARELLYTEEERKRKREEIRNARQKVERLRQRYFGPEGELYSRQKSLMRPLQERILKATEEVAQQDGYDYIFDKGEEVLFMYAREEHNVSDAVLRELGINVDQEGGRP
jgi:outer membrane protein